MRNWNSRTRIPGKARAVADLDTEFRDTGE
mgnify:CR=1 FL=1